MLKFLKQLISKNEITLIAGTLVAQLVPFIAAPFLTRLFSNEAFGIFGLYYGTLMILSAFANGKFESALLIEKNEKDIPSLFALNLFSTLIIVGFSSLLFWGFNGWIESTFNLEGFSTYWYYLPLGFAGISIYYAAYNLLNRKQAYVNISMGKVFRTLAIAGSSLFFGFLQLLQKLGLLIAEGIGQILGGLFLLLFARKHIRTSGISWLKMKELAFRYKKFPLFLIPSSFVNQTAAYLPFYYFASLGTQIAGIYTLTHRITYAPSAIVAASFGDVFKQKAAQSFSENGQCLSIFKSTFKQLLLLGSIPYVILQFASEPLFAIVFGEAWRASGTYAQILAPLFIIQFIVSPLSNTLVIAHKQNLVFYLQCLQLSLVALAVFFSIRLELDPANALSLMVAANAVKYIFELLFSFKASKG